MLKMGDSECRPDSARILESSQSRPQETIVATHRL